VKRKEVERKKVEYNTGGYVGHFHAYNEALGPGFGKARRAICFREGGDFGVMGVGFLGLAST
jgi:hypothetical protein